MKAATIVSVLLVLAPSFVCATPQQPISETRALQLLQERPFRVEIDNLNRMAFAFGVGKEEAPLLGIVGVGNESINAVDTFLELAILYQRMTCVRDKAELSRAIPAELQNAKLTLDAAITGIIGYGRSLTSAPTVEEAQRLRDRMQELRQELDKYHY